MIMLPNPKEGYEGFISFHGNSRFALSAGGDLRLDANKALFARSDTGNKKLYTWEGLNDYGSEFSGHIQTGLAGAPGLEFYTVDAYETFLIRGSVLGDVDVAPVSSYILDAEGGTVAAFKTIDIEERPVLGSAKGADLRGRFFGLRYEFTTPISFKWLGARLSAILRKG